MAIIKDENAKVTTVTAEEIFETKIISEETILVDEGNLNYYIVFITDTEDFFLCDTHTGRLLGQSDFQLDTRFTVAPVNISIVYSNRTS